MYMMRMMEVGMLTKADLEGFSEELQQQIAFAFEK